MTHTAAIDPIVRVGLLLGGSQSCKADDREGCDEPDPTSSPRSAWKDGRGRVRGMKGLPGRGGRRRRLPRRRGCSCHFARSLLKCRRRFDAADSINSIMK